MKRMGNSTLPLQNQKQDQNVRSSVNTKHVQYPDNDSWTEDETEQSAPPRHQKYVMTHDHTRKPSKTFGSVQCAIILSQSHQSHKLSS